MKVILAPNAFKGSLTATQVATAMAEGVRRVQPMAEIVKLPMADGGEGTLDIVVGALNGVQESLYINTVGTVPYGVLQDETCVIEVAKIVGPQIQAIPARLRTTHVLGELLRELLDRGRRRFLIGLGGSTTNDAGTGMLSALGMRCFDQAGSVLNVTPLALAHIDKIDFTSIDSRLRASDLTVMADVNNILHGERGATFMFGPQKGLARNELAPIDANIAHFADLADAWAGHPYSQAPGSGAAGGLGYALQLLGGKYVLGAEHVAKLIGLDTHLATANWVITGEGKTDFQTLQGKAPFIVAQHAAKFQVPVTLVSGSLDEASLPSLAEYFQGCYAIMDASMGVEEAMSSASRLIANRVAQSMRIP